MFNEAQNVLIHNGTFVNIEHSGRTGLQLLLLHITHGATHDSAERFPPPKCHPKTRQAIVNSMNDWVDDLERTSSVLWLEGPASAGKTAIAQTFCELLQKTGKLAGSFFFARTATRSNPQYLFATLAYQLAIVIPELGQIIDKVVADNPSIVMKSMDVQLQKLVIEPLQTLDLSTRPTVIVIDGLDECDGENMQCYILQLIGSIFEHGIFPICFVFTSRPEPRIRSEFDSVLLSRNTRRISLEQTAETDEDIRTFLEAGFSDIRDSPKHRQSMANAPQSWPSPT